MSTSFTRAPLGRTGLQVHRLGLSASYWPGKRAIHRALDHGLDFLFCFGFDLQMMRVLRDVLRAERDRFVVATGAYNYVRWHQDVRRTLEKRLRQLRTDHVDVFLFLGVLKEDEFTERARDELARAREEGKVRAIGISTHDRKLAGKLAEGGGLDVLMIRYNAAHRGAEREIFPHTQTHQPGIIAYTATRWRSLLRRPRGWPKNGFVPDAGMCYRFVLSSPHVHVCLMAPSNARQLDANLRSVARGPLSDEERAAMESFGDAVYRSRRWFFSGR